jgi:hypothetical protein
MRQSTQIDIDDEARIEDKLTFGERQQLRLRFLIDRWNADISQIKDSMTPPRNKRDAARWRCPYRNDDADALRELADTLIELANRIDRPS